MRKTIEDTLTIFFISTLYLLTYSTEGYPTIEPGRGSDLRKVLQCSWGEDLWCLFAASGAGRQGGSHRQLHAHFPLRVCREMVADREQLSTMQSAFLLDGCLWLEPPETVLDESGE